MLLTRFSTAAVHWLGALLLLATCGAPPRLPRGDVVTLEVAPHRVECTGEAAQRCLLVRWLPAREWTRFYDAIEGFAPEEGYRYRIEVERRDVPNPPADASRFHYRLLRVVTRERGE